jgi:asparagine synthase (glutamine-hydrolysing)
LDSYDKEFLARQFIFGSGSFLPSEASKLIEGFSFKDEELFSEAASYEKKFKQEDTLNKSLFLDCKIQLPDWYLVKGDRATMAASLEMRNPLLDKELAEFVFSLSGSWKIKNLEQKYLLKKLASKYIDKDTIYRPKKGFGVPLDEWIRKELKNLFDEYLFIDNGFFNQSYVRAIYEAHQERRMNNEFKLLRIFSFNYWYKKYYELS